jgi:hypothetical protein
LKAVWLAKSLTVCPPAFLRSLMFGAGRTEPNKGAWPGVLSRGERTAAGPPGQEKCPDDQFTACSIGVRSDWRTWRAIRSPYPAAELGRLWTSSSKHYFECNKQRSNFCPQPRADSSNVERDLLLFTSSAEGTRRNCFARSRTTTNRALGKLYQSDLLP